MQLLSCNFETAMKTSMNDSLQKVEEKEIIHFGFGTRTGLVSEEEPTYVIGTRKVTIHEGAYAEEISTFGKKKQSR